MLDEFDFSGQLPQHLVAVENTEEVHNVVVCRTRAAMNAW